MPGIFGSGKPRLLGQVPEEIGGGRAEFQFSDSLGGAPKLVDVPESGAGADPQTILKRVESKPSSPVLKTVATLAALSGRPALLNYLERKEEEPLAQQEQASKLRTFLTREKAEKQRKEHEAVAPEITFDKSNDRLVVVDKGAVRRGNLKNAVKFISLRDSDATIAGLQQASGITFTEEETKGLKKVIESGDETLFRQTVDRITKRAAQEEKEKEFQTGLEGVLNQVKALQSEQSFSVSEKADFESSLSRAIQGTTLQPLDAFIEKIGSNRRQDIRAEKAEDKAAKRSAESEGRVIRTLLETARKSRVQSEISTLGSQLTDLRSRLRKVDSLIIEFGKNSPAAEEYQREQARLQIAISSKEGELKTKQAELEEGVLIDTSKKTLAKPAPRYKAGDTVVHQGVRKRVSKVNDDGTLVLEPIK